MTLEEFYDLDEMEQRETVWENGEFLGRDDHICLQHAATKGLTLVTYERKTITPLLKS